MSGARLAAACILLALAGLGAGAAAARADEKPATLYAEARTLLAFRVGDAVTGRLLPAGWQAVPYGDGPLKGADLAIDFADGLAVRNPDGSAGAPVRSAIWSIPARRKDGAAAGTMVVGGLVSNQTAAPGAFGVFIAARVVVDREVRTDPGGISTVEEAWRFTGDNNDAIDLQLKFTRGTARPETTEARVYSAAKPGFYRLDRITEAVDAVRSPAAAIDRAQSAVFSASGPRLTPVFRAAELLAVVSVPVCIRSVSLPE